MSCRRRSDDDPFEDHYEWDGYLTSGTAHGVPLPFNLLDEEADAVRAELRERERRRIPPGFAVPPPAPKPRRRAKPKGKPAGR